MNINKAELGAHRDFSYSGESLWKKKAFLQIHFNFLMPDGWNLIVTNIYWISSSEWIAHRKAGMY
jgi:hypothetical protein